MINNLINKAFLSILLALSLSANVAAQSPKPSKSTTKEALKTWQGNLEPKQFNDFLKGKYQGVQGDVFIINSRFKNLQALKHLVDVDGHILIGNQDEKYPIGGNPDLVSLQGLENLRTVSGRLRLSSNPSLQSLSALKNLESVGYLLIQENNLLESLAGLENLKKATYRYGGLSIWKNKNLKHIKALSNLVELSRTSISDNPSLESLEGLHNVHEIKRSVYIDKNPKLKDLRGLRNLKAVGDYFQIRSNNGLKDFSGLESLERIEGFFSVSKNKQLTSFKGLNKLVYVDDLWIKESPKLATLDGLNELANIKSSLEIINNASLNSLEALNKLKKVGYKFRVYNNPKLASINGFKNLEEVSDLDISSALTPSSFPRLSRVKKLSINVDITLQADELSVAGWLPKIKTVELLSITSNEQLTSLKGLLENLKEAEKIYIGNNKSLESFDGLNSLEKAKEIAIKYHHDGMYSISGFNALKSLERLDIVKNKYLADISGFNRLATAKNIYLTENRDLKNISGFNGLKKVEVLWIKENPGILKVTGFSNLEQIKSTFWIDENPLLSNLEGFRNLQEVQELSIDQNPRLTNLRDFKSLNKTDSLRIAENDGLKNLDGLQGLTLVSSVRIEDNPNLESLAGLNNFLAAIDFNIKNNDALKNLSGLDSFRQIEQDGGLYIHQNHELTSLSGIENMRYLVGKLKIYKNPKLNDFDGLSLSALARLANKDVTIYDNADNPNLNDLRLSAALTRIAIPKHELEKQTLRRLKLLRNEVFARKGYANFSDELSAHFSKKGWYKPENKPLEIKLSEIEETNIKAIKEIEDYRANQVANIVKQLKSAYKHAQFLPKEDGYFKPSMLSFIKHLNVKNILNSSSHNISYDEAYYIADDNCEDSLSLYITPDFDELTIFVRSHFPYQEQNEEQNEDRKLSPNKDQTYCNLRVKSTKPYDEGGALEANGCWIEPYQCEEQETSVQQTGFIFKLIDNKLKFEQRMDEEDYYN